MLKTNWRRVTGAIGSGLALLLIASWFSPMTGQICGYAYETHEKNCSAYSVPLFLALEFGEFLDAHNGAVIAVFTAILTVATILLWNAGERHSERELRAYVGLVRHSINAERHEFVIVTKNDGQTPARGVTPIFNQQWYSVGEDMPDDFGFADYAQTIGSGPVYITPGQEAPWSFQLTWDRFMQFANGQLGQFYIYGRFEY